VDSLPAYARHHYLAALMVAAEKTIREKLRFGKALAFLLETLGPAETKIGQNAESHPNIRKDIREDLKRLKIHADEPPLWDIWQWIDQNVPASVRKNIKHVGEVLGSASLYVVVKVEMKNGDKNCLALLRPFSERKLENGFNILAKALKKLDENHPYYEILVELLEQGKEDGKREMNYRLSKRQYQKGQETYGKTTVVVDGEEFHFCSPKILAIGPRFRLMEKIEGPHFLELPNRKANDRKRKKRIAMAILTFEINQILKGLPFDSDRHGGNIRVLLNLIGHFDLGAMVLEKPTEGDLKQLAEVLYQSVLVSNSVKGFSEGLLREIRKLREEGEKISPYVTRVQKALLSLGEYVRLLKPDELKRVLVSAGTQGVHPTITQVIFEKIATPIMMDPLRAIRSLDEIKPRGRTQPAMGFQDLSMDSEARVQIIQRN